MLQQRQHFEAIIRQLEDDLSNVTVQLKQNTERAAKMRLMAEK